MLNSAINVDQDYIQIKLNIINNIEASITTGATMRPQYPEADEQ